MEARRLSDSGLRRVCHIDAMQPYPGSSPDSDLAAVQVASFLTSDFLFQLEPVPFLSRYAPQHLFHFSIEASEADCPLIRSVGSGGRCRRPLKATPAGNAARLRSTIRPWGRLMAPGTWPAA